MTLALLRTHIVIFIVEDKRFTNACTVGERVAIIALEEALAELLRADTGREVALLGGLEGCK